MNHINLGYPSLLAFSGPDAVRFLNGQLTQDVRLVATSDRALPACITDAKGKLQFRVWLHSRGDMLLVEGPEGLAEEIEARLTRYLIADDVEVHDLSGQWQLHHLVGQSQQPAPDGVITRAATRFGELGCDWWIPADSSATLLDRAAPLAGDALEAFRIGRGIPAWGHEITPGILPPEAGLDATDISYHKGCYIGQEVISRIKSAGKVNRRLTRLSWDADLPTDGLQIVDADGNPAGSLTSISPTADGDQRHALGFIKRGADGICLQSPDGRKHSLTATVV